MDFKEIKELIKLIDKSELADFKLKDGEFEVTIRTERYYNAKKGAAQQAPQQTFISPATQVPVVQAAAPTAAPAPSEEVNESASPAAEEQEGKYLEVKSPIVGTFYRAPSPEKPPYLKVGDSVSEGSVVCIVEAMKLFNEIESEVSGKVVKVVVEDAQPVEYDQVLFLVDPNG